MKYSFPKSSTESYHSAKSEEQEYIDQCITFLFNQVLTQAGIALCLAVTDSVHVSVSFNKALSKITTLMELTQVYWDVIGFI